MIKHCTRCYRRWSVSVMDKQKYYICPECAERERAWLEKKGLEDAKKFGEMMKE